MKINNVLERYFLNEVIISAVVTVKGGDAVELSQYLDITEDRNSDYNHAVATKRVDKCFDSS